VPGQAGDVQAVRGALDRIEILGERFEGPRKSGLQGIERHAFDVLERSHDGGAMLGLRRRNPEPAVARHDCGHTVPGRWGEIPIPQDLRVEVGVRIDESRCENQTLKIDRDVAPRIDALGDLDDLAAHHGDVGATAG
jgi:hypothetical protein